MNQYDIQQVIKRFLEESVDGFNAETESDKKVLYVMTALLEESENQGDTTRTVYGDIDSDMEFKAYSLKLSNLLQLKKASTWMKIFAKASAVAGGVAAGNVAFGLPEKLKLASSIFSFLAIAASDGGIVKFNEQDAKLLYAIFRLGKTFSKQDLLTMLEELNDEFPNKFEIDENRSLEKFVENRVLSPDTRDGIYVVMEDIKF